MPVTTSSIKCHGLHLRQGNWWWRWSFVNHKIALPMQLYGHSIPCQAVLMLKFKIAFFQAFFFLHIYFFTTSVKLFGTKSATRNSTERKSSFENLWQSWIDDVPLNSRAHLILIHLSLQQSHKKVASPTKQTKPGGERIPSCIALPNLGLFYDGHGIAGIPSTFYTHSSSATANIIHIHSSSIHSSSKKWH